MGRALLIVGLVCALGGFGLGRLTAPADDANDIALDPADGDVAVEDLVEEAMRSDAAPEGDDGGMQADGADPELRGRDGPVTRGHPLHRLETRIRRAYAKLSGGEKIPADLLSQTVDQIERSYDHAPTAYANQAWKREQLRQKVGEIENPVEIIFQTSRYVSLHGADNPYGVRKFEEAPFPLERDAKGKVPGKHYLKGGLIPLGHVLIIESVDLEVLWSDRSRGQVSVGGAGRIQIDQAGTAARARYEGHAIVYPRSDQTVFLSVRGGAAKAVLRGRLITRDAWTTELGAGGRPRMHGMKRVHFEGEGLLTPGPVKIQISSAYGARIDGLMPSSRLNAKRDTVTEHEVWHEDRFPEKKHRNLIYYENGGAIPHGMVYEVTRIDYRAKFAPDRKKYRGSLSVRLGRERIVETAAKESGPTLEGTWRGTVRIRRGRESDLYFQVGQRTIAELVIHGRLIDESAGR